MLALYRCGRQADALAAFQAARGRFVEELGIEPARAVARAARGRPDARPPGSRPRSTARRASRGQRRASLGRPRVAGAAQPDDRSRARRRRGRRAAAGRVGAAAHPHRARRGRQDTARRWRPRARSRRTSPTARASSRSPRCTDPRTFPRRSSRRSGSSCSRASRPTRPPSASWPPSTCCWSPTTSSSCWRPRRSSAGLLEACPALTVLATSREPLALQAEERYPVSPLALPEPGTPEDPEALAGATPSRCSASAREPTIPASTSATATPTRSRRSADASTGCRWRSSSRPPAAGCCRRPRSPSASTTALGAPGAGARDAPARQQTLRATIDWSHELLSDDEKRCFARFAVFAGGATVEAAETITGGGLDTLDGLVAKSLLVRRRHAFAPTRLGMLETIRAYAGERFAAARRRRGRARGPLPLLPRARPAPRNRTRAVGRRRPGAPRPAGRRDRQPPRRARLGDRAGRAPSARSRWRRRSAATGSCETATPTPWTGSTRP